MIEMTNEELWKWLLIGNIPVYILVGSLFWGSPLEFFRDRLDHPLFSANRDYEQGFNQYAFIGCCAAILLAEYQIATKFFVEIVPG